MDKIKLWLSSYSPEQLSVLIRRLVEYSSIVVTVLTMLHVSPDFIDVVNKVFADLNSNQVQIISVISGLITAALYIFSLFKTSKGQQIKAVEKQPGLAVGVDTSPDSKAPAVAIAAANDDSRKSIIPLSSVPDKAA